jgi:hypothetical protein
VVLPGDRGHLAAADRQVARADEPLRVGRHRRGRRLPRPATPTSCARGAVPAAVHRSLAPCPCLSRGGASPARRGVPLT